MYIDTHMYVWTHTRLQNDKHNIALNLMGLTFFLNV